MDSPGNLSLHSQDIQDRLKALGNQGECPCLSPYTGARSAYFMGPFMVLALCSHADMSSLQIHKSPPPAHSRPSHPLYLYPFLIPLSILFSYLSSHFPQIP